MMRLMFFQEYVNTNRITESSLKVCSDAPEKEKGIEMGPKRRLETSWADKVLIRVKKGKQRTGDDESKLHGSSEGNSN